VTRWRNSITGGIVVGPDHLPYPYVQVDGKPDALPVVLDTSDYESQTNDTLRRILDNRGLPTSGTKAELVERLTTADDESS
jgi:hypothetical protein